MIRLYMNSNIRNPKNREPVIVIDRGEGALVYANNVVIRDALGTPIAQVRSDMAGLKDAPIHKVRAWVELPDGISVEPR
jgi:uncharacterized protein YxjI